MDINEIIAMRRQELGLTLEDVANACKVNKSTVLKWESGVIKNLRRDKIYSLSQVLQVSPEILMGWEEPITRVEEIQDELFEQKQVLFDKVKNVTPETMDKILQIVDMLVDDK